MRGRVLDLLLAALGLGLAWMILANAVAQPVENPPQAAALARLRRDPLDLTALRALGLSLDRQGRTAEADAILNFVGLRSWRDGPTQAWLFRRRLEQGQFKAAFENADSLLRRDSDGSARPVLFAVLVAAAAYPEARPDLEARLAASPWWRTDFLQKLDSNGDIAGTRTVLAALAAGPTPPTPDEYAPFISRLIRAGAIQAAFAAWTEIAGPAKASPQQSSPLGPRNGDFAGVSDHTAFTWSAAGGVGASSDVRPSPDGSGHLALRVDYDGFSSPELPAQMLVLPPGRYRVVWREDTGGSERMRWQVRCADSGQILAQASRVDDAPPGSTAWRDQAMDFQTPAAGCQGQWLELAAIPGERRDPVTAWFESFKVQPLP